MKSLASSSCSVMCGKPSQQTRKREIASVRNRLFSLARIASKESQRATKVTSGDSDLPEAKARTPRYPSCWRASSTSEDRIFWKSCTLPGERGVAKRGQAWRPPEFRAQKKGCSSSQKGTPTTSPCPATLHNGGINAMVRILSTPASFLSGATASEANSKMALRQTIA